MTLTGRNIVCFSTAEWDAPLPTNQHHLMQRLAARGNRVLFIETLGTRAPRLGSGADLGRMGRRLARGFAGASKRAPRLWTLSPVVRPAWGSATARAFNRTAFLAQARGTLAHFPNPIAWIYSPYSIHLLDLFSPALVIYHCVDDLSAVPGADKDALREAEARLLARADCVFCTERSLYDRARAINAQARLMPNVADYGHFSLPRHDIDDTRLLLLRALRRPRLVFSGHLTPHKVDMDRLLAIATQRPDWSLVLIGPEWEGADPPLALTSLRRLSNVTLLGHVPYDDLPAYLHEADVLLIPYVFNDATRAVSPLKFFEYLATGRPIVASPLPSLLPYANAIALANTDAEWISGIEASLRDPHNLQLQRRALAKKNTWETRLEEMEREIAAREG
jgi:glycosyltransferase involved in cell wall biosynthesis